MAEPFCMAVCHFLCRVPGVISLLITTAPARRVLEAKVWHCEPLLKRHPPVLPVLVLLLPIQSDSASQNVQNTAFPVCTSSEVDDKSATTFRIETMHNHNHSHLS